jgi:hypothetical protein
MTDYSIPYVTGVVIVLNEALLPKYLTPIHDYVSELLSKDYNIDRALMTHCIDQEKNIATIFISPKNDIPQERINGAGDTVYLFNDLRELGCFSVMGERSQKFLKIPYEVYPIVSHVE